MKNTHRPMHPYVHLTNAQLHALYNEPIEPADPPMTKADGRVWQGIIAVVILECTGVLYWIFS